MSCGDLLFEEELLSLFRKIEKAQGIGNGRSALRNGLSYLRLGHTFALHETFVAIRFFDRIQIGALDVLNERSLKCFRVISEPEANGDRFHTKAPACLPATLARDDLITIACLANKNGLEQTMALDRVCKLFDLFWFEICTRLVGIGMNLREQDLAHHAFFIVFHRFRGRRHRSRFKRIVRFRRTCTRLR